MPAPLQSRAENLRLFSCPEYLFVVQSVSVLKPTRVRSLLRVTRAVASMRQTEAPASVLSHFKIKRGIPVLSFKCTVWGPVLGHKKRKLVFLTLE